MNESEQAQAIADAREHKERRRCVDFLIIERDMWNMLEIVDSQAQKIADLNRVGSNTLLALIESQEKIAEQAKEIERLKA